MQIKVGDKVQQSFQTKNIFTLEADDHQYFNSYKTDALANRHQWSEFSFNTCIGPIITLADSVSIRNVMNNIFVDEMSVVKAKMRGAMSSK